MIRRFAFVCLVLAACGSPNVDPFLGSWSVSGNSSLTVGGQPLNNSGTVPATTYTLVFSKGNGADLQSLDSYGCKLLWSVSGDTATLNAMQSCTITLPNSQTGPLVVAVTSGTASVTSLGAGQMSGTGNLSGTYGVMGTMSTAVSATVGGTLTKAP